MQKKGIETLHDSEVIYVALLGEGTNVWRPVKAEKQPDGTYVIVSRNVAADDEIWESSFGSVVRCEPRRFSGNVYLVAVSGDV